MSAYLSGSLEKHKAVMFSKFNFLKYLKQIFDGKKKKKNQVVFSVSDFIKWGKKTLYQPHRHCLHLHIRALDVVMWTGTLKSLH